MNSKKYFNLSIITILLMTNQALAVERIENFYVNRKEVQKVYLSFSKAIIFRFPEAIEEVRIGLPNFYKAEISKRFKREMTVYLIENISIPTNIIIRTTSSDLYAFDLVPSSTNNQDIIFVDRSHYPISNDKDNSKRISIFKGKKSIYFENMDYL